MKSIKAMITLLALAAPLAPAVAQDLAALEREGKLLMWQAEGSLWAATQKCGGAAFHNEFRKVSLAFLSATNPVPNGPQLAERGMAQSAAQYSKATAQQCQEEMNIAKDLLESRTQTLKLLASMAQPAQK